MARKGEGWLQGRTRPVRVVLTEEEHKKVRIAAARADKSISRYAVEAILRVADEDSREKKKK
jgi:hypothetical protein